ncbi:MAG: YciI family protein [Gaiellaceae bacterium MAG52_C11]|nr:YciI family protein [Candidatus Gaiellasilicea maunaloa]
MKYALLVYDSPSSWEDVSTEQRRALHGEYHAVAASPGVIGHYRLRQPQLTVTVRVEEGQTMKAEGPPPPRESLRAFYLFESDDHDSVFELAARIPAARMGGAIEVVPLTQR